MAALSDEEKKEIIEVYKELGQFNTTGDKLGYSPATVRKYVNRWEEGELDLDVDPPEKDVEDDKSEHDEKEEVVPEGFTAKPPEGIIEERESSEEDEFVGMSEGDFIKWFFSQDNFGVAEAFSNILAKKCDMRGKLPDKAELANELMKGKSRISNAATAESIAEVYWDAAQRYMQVNGQQMNGQQQYVTPGGQWVEGGNGGVGQNNPQQAGGGQWVSPDNPQHPPQNNQYPPQNPPQNNQSQDDEVTKELLKELKNLKNRQEAIVEFLDKNGQNNQQKQRSLKSEAREIAELQKTLGEIYAGDGESDAPDEIRQEIGQLRQELSQLAQQSVESGSEESGDDLSSMIKLAAENDLDPDTIGAFAESLGVSRADPEIEKEKFKTQRQKMELEKNKEKWETILDGVENVSSGLLETGISTLFNSSDDDGSLELPDDDEPTLVDDGPPAGQRRHVETAKDALSDGGDGDEQ